MSKHRSIALGSVSALAIAVMVGLGVAPAPQSAFAETTAVVDGQLHSYADIVAADKPAVVTVTTEMAAPEPAAQGDMQNMPPEEFFRRFFGENGPMPGMPGMPGGPGENGGPQRGPAMALGSGFIISADGTVVTNNHVVDGATKITVTLDDGTELPAKLVGTDAKNDIAVLKVESKDKLPIVTWGDSDA